MITPTKTHTAVLAALACLALPCLPVAAQTADDLIIDQFGDDTGVFSWSRAWGITPLYEWDPAENSTVNPNPAGAMKVTIDFDLATYQGDNQTAMQRQLPEIVDFELYKNIHLDIKVDDSSSRLSTSWGAGQFGGIDIIARTGDWSIQRNNITTSDPWLGASDYGVWRSYTLPVDQTLLDHHNMAALMLHIWSGWVEPGGVTGGHTNTVTMWFDNIYFEKNTNTAPVPPPTLSLGPATSGLYCLASLTGGQYQRQGIRTVSDQYGWHGASGPVTYELTIKEPPNKDGFQAHMFLIPNSTGDTAPDWNRPDAIWFGVYDGGDGTANASFGFKTNEPSGNSQIYGANHLADLASTKVVGTWKLTFQNNTDITVTAPDGATTNFVMDAEAAALFNAPVTVYVGSQPGNTGYVGSGYVFSNVKITGVPAPVDDSFAGPDLNPDLWAVAADNAPGVFIAPAGAAYFLQWTLPAVGFDPQVAGTLGAGPWTDLNPANARKIGADMRLLLAASELPPGTTAFFRMTQRQFTKLQVLLPGETAAPGTPTGKTGTPTPQNVGVPFDIIVNAVDDAWNLAATGRDTINLTCTEPFATLPADAALVAGTRTFTVTLNDVGTHTITATDVTDGTKTANTSSSVTVNP